MALSDEQKLSLVQTAIAEWVHGFVDWASLKVALQNLTKSGIKTYILNVIQAEAAADSTASTNKTELYTEVTNDI